MRIEGRYNIKINEGVNPLENLYCGFNNSYFC